MKNSFRNPNRNNYKQAWRKVVNKGAFRIFAIRFRKKIAYIQHSNFQNATIYG